jgi:hypothetical protein
MKIGRSDCFLLFLYESILLLGGHEPSLVSNISSPSRFPPHGRVGVTTVRKAPEDQDSKFWPGVPPWRRRVNPMPPTPNGYGGGLCIAVRLDGDVARAHGTGTGSDQWDRVTVSLCRRLAALRWGAIVEAWLGICASRAAITHHLRTWRGVATQKSVLVWACGPWPVARGG